MQAVQNHRPPSEVPSPSIPTEFRSSTAADLTVESNQADDHKLFRVLVIEDDAILLSLYEALLNDEKVQAELCADGLDALQRLSSSTFDLVITDIELPGLDGISLLQWIQKHRPETDTVVISGDGSPQKILTAMRGGAKDYIVKPFTFDQFHEMILRQRRQRRPFNPHVFSSLIKQLVHDVRGEMVNLEIMLKLCQREKSKNLLAEDHEKIVGLKQKIRHIKALTEDYAILSRHLLQEGGVPSAPISLKRDVLGELVEEMQDSLQRKKLKVSARHDLTVSEDATVLGNRLMLKSAFRTLFSNAIKHCTYHGRLTYGISSNNKRYKIFVANEGEIVPPHLQEAMFGEFVQLRPQKGERNLSEGMGLGLGLAKGILRQHGGDIWYESFTEGSKFVCTLPAFEATAR